MKRTTAVLALFCLACLLAACSSNLPPLAVEIFYTRTSAAGLILTAEATVQISSYEWTFEGGDKSSDAEPSYAFDQRGTYTINLNVLDKNGRHACTHIEVSVGRDWYVPQDGVLQFVVDEAEPGDTVFIVRGSYGATIDKDLDLRSLGGELSAVSYHGVNGSMTGFEVRGAGLRLLDSSPSITGCTFSGNRATNGGAVYAENSGARFEDCTFSNNSAEYSGGAVYAIGSHSFPSFYSCEFLTNHSGDAGGAAIFRALGGSLDSEAQLPRIEECLFVQNTARQNPANPVPSVGGAIHVGSGCRVIQRANEFRGNAPADVIIEDVL